MARQFEASDEGKTVVTGDGDEVGTIEKIDNNMAHVRPGNSLSQSIRRRLGWAEDNADTYELTQSQVAGFSDDEVTLQD
ncbi:hypothetical protein [Halolamina sp.]|jgi:hypothetical protein|uniref:hypothetical protein n=1 Tax=Halolamina sp. TaxID=1940283 RepID=UPI000223C005|nr:hypothetical protein Halar_2804 [halophilic archaeon DL31]